MRTIVTDARYKMSLAPIRAFAGAGARVTAADLEGTDERLLLGFYSNRVSERVMLPRDEEAFVPALKKLCRAGERPVLFPSGRRTLGIVAAHPELADDADFLVSPPAVLDAADDKARVRAAARALGVPTPETWYFEDFGTVRALSAGVRYPCIVKYRNGEKLGLHSWQRYRLARTPEELEAAWTAMDAVQKSPMVQEYLSSRDVGLAVVTDENADPVDFLCYESEKEYPTAGGPTCLCRTIFDRELLRRGCAVLKALNFRGLAMLDFKGPPEDAKLLEINPRLWGSAELCVVSGSPLFLSYAAAAKGEAEPADAASCEPRYRVGAGMRFTPQNLAAFVSDLRGGRRPLGRALRTAFDPSIRDGLYCAGDPKPYFRYVLNQLSGRGKS